MIKRILDCKASDFCTMSKGELMDAMAAGEGRVIACETIGALMPMLGDITNAEFVASQGADLIILNMFDVKAPVIKGLPKVAPERTVWELKRLTGRPIAINLEPVEEESQVGTSEMWAMTEGRKATVENAKTAVSMGVNMIVLTGNPGMGVTNQAIIHSLEELSKAVGEKVILAAGKMHAAGSLTEAGENIITKKDIEEFIKAGADIILLPAPGTVPGITMEYIRELVAYSHSKGALTLTAVGTSQEGADKNTIRQIALWCKMTGTDIHHLGDAGYGGMALPENIQAYSITIRGIRHTYHRMACSINR